MLDNYKGSPDAAFSRDIHTIATNTTAIAQSIAVIAGILAKREGIGFIDPTKRPLPTQDHQPKPTSVSNSPDIPSSAETQASLGKAVSDAYGYLASDPAFD